jgi:hypothetical protein
MYFLIKSGKQKQAIENLSLACLNDELPRLGSYFLIPLEDTNPDNCFAILQATVGFDDRGISNTLTRANGLYQHVL